MERAHALELSSIKSKRSKKTDSMRIETLCLTVQRQTRESKSPVEKLQQDSLMGASKLAPECSTWH